VAPFEVFEPVRERPPRTEVHATINPSGHVFLTGGVVRQFGLRGVHDIEVAVDGTRIAIRPVEEGSVHTYKAREVYGFCFCILAPLRKVGLPQSPVRFIPYEEDNWLVVYDAAT